MSLKSKNMIFGFWHFLVGYCLGFNLVKTPQRLGNWFQRYKQLKIEQTIRNKTIGFVWGILKTVFARFNSFCWSHHIWSLKSDESITMSYVWYCPSYLTLKEILSICAPVYTHQGFFSKFLMGGTQNFRSPSVPDGDKVRWGGGDLRKIRLKPKLPT